MTQLQHIASILAIWFIVSVPFGLLVAAVMKAGGRDLKIDRKGEQDV